MHIRWLSGLSLSLALVACGTATQPEPSAAPRPQRARAPVVVGEIGGEAHPDLTPGSVFANRWSYTVQLTPVADAQNTNPNNTIEVFSAPNILTKFTNGQAGNACTGTDSIQAEVSILSFMPEALKNVQVGMVNVDPVSNKICTPRPANADPAIDNGVGVIDYSGNGAVSLGAWNNPRTTSPASASTANGGPVPAMWAFTLPNGSPFTWRARIVADLRPYPAKVNSIYVDASTATTTNPQVSIISDDLIVDGSTTDFRSIVNAVHLWTFTDPGLTASAGDVDKVVVMDTTGLGASWGLGNITTAAASPQNVGRTIYAQMQNEWSVGTPVLGQKLPPGTDPFKTFLVTAPATVPPLMPAVGSNVSGNHLAIFTPASQAVGADIEIRQQLSNGRGGFFACSASQGPLVFTGTGVAVPGPYNLNLATPSPAFVVGTKYCYRVRNGFNSFVGQYYGGSWSGYSDFVW
jgi:hypothetical protein